jgi:hypothetical protein
LKRLNASDHLERFLRLCHLTLNLPSPRVQWH